MAQPLRFTFLVLRGQNILAIDDLGQLWLGRFPSPSADDTVVWERIISMVEAL